MTVFEMAFFERMLNLGEPYLEDFVELTQEEFNMLSLDDEVEYTHKLSGRIVAEQNEDILQYWISKLNCDVD